MPATSIALFIAAFLAALSPLAAAAQSDAGKTLRVVPHADLTVVDPQFIGVYITRNFGYLVYDTLFGMDRDFRPQPEMVDSWQASDDKLTYTFRLRDGLKFHDGQPVRAADAVASLKRWGQRNDSYGQPLLAAASAIEALDDKEFRAEKPLPGTRSARHDDLADSFYSARAARQDRRLHANNRSQRFGTVQIPQGGMAAGP
jgi:ABC-type transport system substrate-binding protein